MNPGSDQQADTLPFLKLVAHDLRWNLIRQLARGDLRVSELTAGAGQTGNLISYHLQQLRSERLVRERRSSEDAREVYYSLDLDRFGRLLTATASSVHPALVHPAVPAIARTAGARPAVLFLCTHNSARSQMAEGLLRARSADHVEVTSAGSDPTRLHPLAIDVMRRANVDISHHETRHVNDLVARHFDYVITVCDSVRENCPAFATSPELIHWSIADPSAGRTIDERRAAFRAVLEELESRIRHLLIALDASAA